MLRGLFVIALILFGGYAFAEGVWGDEGGGPVLGIALWVGAFILMARS